MLNYIFVVRGERERERVAAWLEGLSLLHHAAKDLSIVPAMTVNGHVLANVTQR